MRRRPTRPAMLEGLLAWDAALKARGINPGTSADLTVATLFAELMRFATTIARATILPSARQQ